MVRYKIYHGLHFFELSRYLICMEDCGRSNLYARLWKIKSVLKIVEDQICMEDCGKIEDYKRSNLNERLWKICVEIIECCGRSAWRIVEDLYGRLCKVCMEDCGICIENVEDLHRKLWKICVKGGLHQNTDMQCFS